MGAMTAALAELLLAGVDDGSAEFYTVVDDAGAEDVAAVLALADHADPEVRRRVVRVLPLLAHGDLPTPELIEAAVRLSGDDDAQVRDWACFALGRQWPEVDTPEVRAALAARLDDADDEARCEALVGLSYRQDERALPRVRAALSRPDGEVWTLELEAAAALGDPSLHDLVRQHQDGWDDEDGARTAQLALRLTDPTGPGEDVFDGVAELSRRRAHGEPDGEALAAWHLMHRLLGIAPRRAGEFFRAVLARLEGDDAAQRELRENSALAQDAHDYP